MNRDDIGKNTISNLTIRDLLRILTSRFNQSQICFGHGYPNALSEAWALICYAIDIPIFEREIFLASKLTKKEVNKINHLAASRINQRIPIAYLTNEIWLEDFHFIVDNKTIIPRSLLAKPIFDRLTPWLSEDYQCKNILDLGCGGGSLSIIAAHAFGESQVIGVDIDKNAISLAKKNVAKYNLTNRVEIIHSDLFENVTNKKFNLIISNPPYVDSKTLKNLPREYTFEPKLALDGGNNGLKYIIKIIDQAKKWLSHNGYLLLEIGGNINNLLAKFPKLKPIFINNDSNQESILLLSYHDLPK